MIFGSTPTSDTIIPENEWPTRTVVPGCAATLHSQYGGVPPGWVHIIFLDYAAGSGFTAGSPAATVALTLLIRTGHTADFKVGLLTRVWELLQDATGAPDIEIVVGIQEVPASQAMEMGKIMPDVAGATIAGTAQSGA